MNPNEQPTPQVEASGSFDPGIAEASPPGPGGDPSASPTTGDRPRGFTLWMIAPALLVTVALGVGVQAHQSQRDEIVGGILACGLGGSAIAAIFGAIRIARHWRNRQTAAFAGCGAFVAIFLLNVLLMFGGCLFVVGLLFLQ